MSFTTTTTATKLNARRSAMYHQLKYGSQKTGLRGEAPRSSYVPVAVASPVTVAAPVKKTVKEKKAKVVKPETIVVVVAAPVAPVEAEEDVAPAEPAVQWTFAACTVGPRMAKLSVFEDVEETPVQIEVKEETVIAKETVAVKEKTVVVNENAADEEETVIEDVTITEDKTITEDVTITEDMTITEAFTEKLIAHEAGIALKTVDVEEVFNWLEEIIQDDKKAELVIESIGNVNVEFIGNVDVEEVFGWLEDIIEDDKKAELIAEEVGIALKTIDVEEAFGWLEGIIEEENEDEESFVVVTGDESFVMIATDESFVEVEGVSEDFVLPNPSHVRARAPAPVPAPVKQANRLSFLQAPPRSCKAVRRLFGIGLASARSVSISSDPFA